MAKLEGLLSNRRFHDDECQFTSKETLDALEMRIIETVRQSKQNSSAACIM